MKIALIGYGNMNREIERLLHERGDDEVVSISYKTRSERLDIDGLKQADVAIDFTAPDLAVATIERVITLGIPLVIGTTGWYDLLPSIQESVKKRNAGLIYGQNFSVGANIFFEVTAYASSLMSQVDGYDVFGIETHHTGKKDSPSGTARKLADVVIENYPRKKALQTEALQRKITDEELHFVSVRGGRNFGRHEIVFDSNADEIRLTHQAWGRSGFAEGAMLAAQFIHDKKGFYDFSEVFKNILIRKEEGIQ